MSNPENEILTIEEAVRDLRVGKTTVYKLAQEDNLVL